MAMVIDENSKPGVYLGATRKDGKWYPIMTVVHPLEFRSKLTSPVQHGRYPQGFDTEMEAEAFVRAKVLPDVQSTMGDFFDETVELRPVGSA